MVQQICADLLRRPEQVFSIFAEYFGEDRVDLQGCPNEAEIALLLGAHTLGSFISAPSKHNTEEENSLWETFKSYSILQIPKESFLSIWSEELRHKVAEFTCNNIRILLNLGEVRVTNENNRYEDIQGLWAQIFITYLGEMKGSFKVNRSEYTFTHLRNNYFHSHVYGIPSSDFSLFQTSCLGEGPIRGTIASLSIDFDELRWQLFCIELDNYVHTESIKGGPYNSLQQLRQTQKSVVIPNFTGKLSPSSYNIETLFHTGEISNFVKYFIAQKQLQFNFSKGNFGLAMSFIDYNILISNIFIEWLNKNYQTVLNESLTKSLFDTEVLYYGTIMNNKIYLQQSDVSKVEQTRYNELQNKYICTFKGQDVLLKIVNDNTQHKDTNIILDPVFAEALLIHILKILNYDKARK